MGDLEARVHEQAACFIKHRAREFLKAFLITSEINRDLYKQYLGYAEGEILSLDKFTEHLVDDHQRAFGQVAGLAYALGYADHLQGKTFEQLFVPADLADEPAPDNVRQLKLPGILD